MLKQEAHTRIAPGGPGVMGGEPRGDPRPQSGAGHGLASRLDAWLATRLSSAAESPGGAATRLRGSWMLALSSFFFVLLQSACAAVMAISGLRLLIGFGSLAAASGLKIFAGAFHDDAIRIPMLVLSVGGSLLNLYVIWRIRSLRARPSSQWRMVPATVKQKRAEAFQIGLAVVSLVLVGAEWVSHIYVHGGV